MKQLTASSSYSVLFQTLKHLEDSSRFPRPVIQDDGGEADHSVMESLSSRSCHSWLFPSSCRILTETVIKQIHCCWIMCSSCLLPPLCRIKAHVRAWRCLLSVVRLSKSLPCFFTITSASVRQGWAWHGSPHSINLQPRLWLEKCSALKTSWTSFSSCAGRAPWC